MQFSYTAKTPGGKSTAGILDALSISHARSSLRAQGLFPLNVREQASTGSLSRSFSWRPTGRRVRKSDVLMVTSQLAIMCRSGIAIAEALRAVAGNCNQGALRDSLHAIYNDVTNGDSASAALKRHANIFGDAYVTSIAAAEASGTVAQVLTRLTDMLRNQIRLEGNLRSVAAYPVVLMGVAAVVLTTLIFFVLPQFATVFVNLGRPAPPFTAVLLESATFIRRHLLEIGLAGLCAMIALRQFACTPTARYHWDRFLLDARLFRHATRSLFAGRSFRLLATMLHSGVPLLEAVRLCRNSVGNRLFRSMFDDIEHDVVNGNGIGGAVARATFIPTGAAQMISTAEHTGNLGEVMELIGEFYEDEGQRSVTQVIKLLEPVVIVVMGAIVATVVLSVVLPLLDVSTISK